MSTVILFHSALGLRPAVRRFAETLRADGHEVFTPDLFEGKVFDRLEDGVAERDAIGIPGLMQRTAEAVAGLPEDSVYMGFSMGAASAQWLAMTRTGARGAVLMHAALPPGAFGLDRWPRRLPAQIHYAAGDPWVDARVVEALRESAPDAVDVHTYGGDGHLFADEEAPEYDPGSASKMMHAVRTFLAAQPSGNCLQYS